MNFRILKIERQEHPLKKEIYFNLLRCRSFLGFQWTTTIRDSNGKTLFFKTQADVLDYMHSVNKVEEFEKGVYKAPTVSPVSSVGISDMITPESVYSPINYPNRVA